jgi:hypothetical protein
MTSNDPQAAARSAAGRLLAGLHKGKPRRRPSESLTVRMPVDARTRAGRAVRLLKVRLLSHLGPRPNPAQVVLVEQLLQLKLRLAMMDHAFIEAGGKLAAHDSRTYLAWSNSLVRGLRELGLDAIARETPLSLADALRAGAQVTGDAPASVPREDAVPPTPRPSLPPQGVP